MDVQGAELGIFKNGSKALRNCLAMQLEVSYFSLYEDQPSFGEVDVYMRTIGFVPHQFWTLKDGQLRQLYLIIILEYRAINC